MNATMRLRLATLVTAVLVGGAIRAQDSLIFSLDSDEFFLDGASGLLEAGMLRQDEAAIFTPGVDTSASVFASMASQWVYIGDLDSDGRYVDASTDGPGLDTDELFVKRFPAGPAGVVGPRDVFFSKESTDGFGTAIEDGDVFRYSAQGTLEHFVREDELAIALGQPGGDIDLNAICQSDTGDLFFSCEFDESAPGGTLEDGGIAAIAASDITYDAMGNVAGITPGSAVIVASEADVAAMILNSGMATSVGGVPSTTSLDLGGLEIDPNGGTWVSPQPGGQVLPNLLFVWLGFSNDGGILSTANGGSIASVNGVPMASATATTGTQIGMLPGSTGIFGINGLALIPQRAEPLVVENYPVNLITSSTILFTRQEISGATPGGTVLTIIAAGPLAVGGFAPAVPAPAPFSGTIYGLSPLTVTGSTVADASGHAAVIHMLPPSLVGSAANFVWMTLDVPTRRFGEPAGLQFL
jgi:hypothetical protein